MTLQSRLSDVVGVIGNDIRDLGNRVSVVEAESPKSNYDLWLEQGNTGTVDDYLASLVGPQGSGFHWKGTWDSATVYSYRDAVQRNGSAYVMVDSSDVVTLDPETNPNEWQLMAAKGDTGATGIPGINWRGTWNNSAVYAYRDAVLRNGSAYIQVDLNGVAINIPPETNSNIWSLLASKGDTGPTFLNVQRKLGIDAAYASVASGQAIYANQGKTIPMQLFYTPAVNCWWEGWGGALFQKLDAAYNLGYLNLTLSPADADGVTSTHVGLSMHSAVDTWWSPQPHRMFKLVAGTAYSMTLIFSANGGTWQYYQQADYTFLEAKAWPR